MIYEDKDLTPFVGQEAPEGEKPEEGESSPEGETAPEGESPSTE
jgi:hypothetical protein